MKTKETYSERKRRNYSDFIDRCLADNLCHRCGKPLDGDSDRVCVSCQEKADDYSFRITHRKKWNERSIVTVYDIQSILDRVVIKQNTTDNETLTLQGGYPAGFIMMVELEDGRYTIYDRELCGFDCEEAETASFFVDTQELSIMPKLELKLTVKEILKADSKRISIKNYMGDRFNYNRRLRLNFIHAIDHLNANACHRAGQYERRIANELYKAEQKRS